MSSGLIGISNNMTDEYTLFIFVTFLHPGVGLIFTLKKSDIFGNWECFPRQSAKMGMRPLGNPFKMPKRIAERSKGKKNVRKRDNMTTLSDV